jgi:plastocyanin
MHITIESAAAFAAIVFVAGVGAGAPMQQAQRAAQRPPTDHPVAPATPVGAATGVIVGRVRWQGALPPRPSTTPPAAMAACGASIPFQALEVGADQGVAWAELSVEGLQGHAAPRTVTLMQHGCVFSPHVLVAPVGSTLSMQNHDPLLHNVHALRQGTSVFNVASIQGLVASQVVTTPGLLVLQCDAGHPWMHAYVHVVTDPFHDVSNAHGAFRIENVPPGHYTVRMWHEGWTPRPSPDGHAAFGEPVVREHTVDVTAGGQSEVNFTLPGT